MSTGRSPFFCSAVLAPFSFPNSPFSSQLHPFRTLKVQWGTHVFLRRRVGSRSVRYRWIFVLKHHRTLAIFGGVLSAVMPTTASRIWLKKRTRHRNPRHFLGGSVLPRPGKKPARGTPKKLSQLSMLSLRGVLPLKSCHRPPWATPKVVTVVTSWGVLPPLVFAVVAVVTASFPFKKRGGEGPNKVVTVVTVVTSWGFAS